jgi:protein-tyrosine phosphatase
MAEQMLRQKFAQRNINNVVVDSAGVYAMEGEPMTNEAGAAMIASGYSTETHIAKQATAEIIASANLVLTATQDHSADIVRTLTRANRFTFTIKEFANLAAYVAEPDPDVELPVATDLADKLVITSMARGYAPEIAVADVEDPYQRGQAVFDATRAELDPLLDAIADWAVLDVK